MHLYFNNRYGYFRDEFDYMACGDHLAWGYVDHPPLIPFLIKICRLVLGDSLRSIRFIPALASFYGARVADGVIASAWLTPELLAKTRGLIRDGAVVGGRDPSQVEATMHTAVAIDENRERALLFKDLATLRIDAPLFSNVDELRWHGPTKSFAAMTEKIGDARLAKRVKKPGVASSVG